MQAVSTRSPEHKATVKMMGLLVDGQWQDQWYDTGDDGSFERDGASFRQQIGEPSLADFPPEVGRYHLYVCMACPWAHRTLIFRQLKGLADIIDVSVVSPDMLENGWAFGDGDYQDHLYGLDFMHQLYTRAKPDYSGRVTVPVLWDKQSRTIVNNESADIIRMFNHAFDELTGNRLDFYPAELREDIDALNDVIYHKVNNGVYKAGFATTQAAYEDAVVPLFNCLDELEQRLNDSRPYLFGSRLTETDWRLFTTLLRFDPVYFGHFKCNLKRIADYPFLSRYLARLRTVEGIESTCNLAEIKRHYYFSHDSINPHRIVPLGPL